jgi:RNA polymerase sigma-70 factor (ECF subfamily)
VQVDSRPDQLFEGLWRAHRPVVIDLAFRMLGNIADAEDVVQDAFSRLLRADLGQIDDVRGWLIVVVSRLCLDVLRSARIRREARPDTAGAALAQLEATGDAPDPADRVTLDDSVRLALLVVLERLSPAARAVFVLHDVFGYRFEAIAAIVGRPADSCRKLASRARRQVESAAGPARFAVETAEHRLVAERFIAACAGGDLDTLMHLLDADVAGQVDLGPDLAPAPAQVGRARVARSLIFHFGGASGVTLVSQLLNGWPGVLAFKGGRLYALAVLQTRDGLINDIHAVRNPRTLALVGGLVEPRR